MFMANKETVKQTKNLENKETVKFKAGDCLMFRYGTVHDLGFDFEKPSPSITQS
jgi:hypothetical protein